MVDNNKKLTTAFGAPVPNDDDFYKMYGSLKSWRILIVKSFLSVVCMLKAPVLSEHLP